MRKPRWKISREIGVASFFAALAFLSSAFQTYSSIIRTPDDIKTISQDVREIKKSVDDTRERVAKIEGQLYAK